MISKKDVLGTLRMMKEENLDVRTVTIGINLNDCRRDSSSATADAIKEKIGQRCGRLVAVCDNLNAEYGLEIVNKRIAVSPMSTLLAGREGADDAVELAKALDESAEAVGIDLIGGFSALVHKGMTPA
ncbi:PFL family protein, partial [bacterium E08(2017)]